LESLTRVAECKVTECATRSVVSRRAWRRATVCSPEEEKGCRLEGAMSSGIRVACNVDRTVAGTSADALSPVMVTDERHNQRLYASLQWTTTLVSKQSSGQRSTVAYNQAAEGISNPAAAHAGDTYSDSSGALFSMYLSRAENYDKERAESWKADADGILIFVRPGFHFIPCCAFELKTRIRPVYSLQL
jgi:hypothetical protein